MDSSVYSLVNSSVDSVGDLAGNYAVIRLVVQLIGDHVGDSVGASAADSVAASLLIFQLNVIFQRQPRSEERLLSIVDTPAVTDVVSRAFMSIVICAIVMITKNNKRPGV